MGVPNPTARQHSPLDERYENARPEIEAEFDNSVATDNAIIANLNEVAADITDIETDLDAQTTGLAAMMAGHKVGELLKWASVSAVNFSADSLGVVNAAGESVVVSDVDTEINAFDALTPAASTGYNVWIFVQADGVTVTGRFSAEADFANIVLPSGYEGGYGRRVGWVLYNGSIEIEFFSQPETGWIRLNSDAAAGSEMGYTSVGSGETVIDWTAYLPLNCPSVAMGFVMTNTDSGAALASAYPNDAVPASNRTTRVAYLGAMNTAAAGAGGVANISLSDDRMFIIYRSNGALQIALAGWYDNW